MNSNNKRIAARYAKSVISLAQELGKLETVKDDLKLFADTCDQNRELRLMLHSPVISNPKKLAILKAIFKSADELTLRFFEVISRKSREPVLYEIATAFVNGYNQLKGIQPVTLTVASPLDKKQLAVFSDYTTKVTGKKAEITEKIDKDIIGGFVFDFDSNRLDASVASKLQAIKVGFAKN